MEVVLQWHAEVWYLTESLSGLKVKTGVLW